MIERPLCINCEHYLNGYPSDLTFEWEDDRHWCNHQRSMVTGETSWAPCFLNRRRFAEASEETYDSCGPEGKFFKRKNNQTNAIPQSLEE